MNKLVVACKDVIHLIRPEDVLYCESDNSYTTIFLNNKEEFIASKSISKVALELNSDKFIRVSQSHLVNKDYIKTIDKKNKCLELDCSKKIRFTASIKSMLNFFMSKI